MLKKFIKIIYSDSLSTFIVFLSIIPLFLYDYDFSNPIKYIFVVYFLGEIFHNYYTKENNLFIYILDVITIFAFFSPYNYIRLIRLLRLLKLFEKIDSIKLLVRVLKNTFKNMQSILVVVMCYIIFVSLLLFNVEPETFNYNFLNALYWCVTSLTTVGYGDIYPLTFLGKFLGSVFALLGVGLIALPAGLIASEFLKISQEDK